MAFDFKIPFQECAQMCSKVKTAACRFDKKIYIKLQFTENVKNYLQFVSFSPHVLLLSFYLNVNPSYTANSTVQKDNKEPLFQLFPKIGTLLLYGSRWIHSILLVARKVHPAFLLVTLLLCSTREREIFLQKFLTGQTLGMSRKKWPPSFVFFGQQVYNTVSKPNMLSGSTRPPSLSE